MLKPARSNSLSLSSSLCSLLALPLSLHTSLSLFLFSFSLYFSPTIPRSLSFSLSPFLSLALSPSLILCVNLANPNVWHWRQIHLFHIDWLLIVRKQTQASVCQIFASVNCNADLHWSSSAAALLVMQVCLIFDQLNRPVSIWYLPPHSKQSASYCLSKILLPWTCFTYC